MRALVAVRVSRAGLPSLPLSRLRETSRRRTTSRLWSRRGPGRAAHPGQRVQPEQALGHRTRSRRARPAKAASPCTVNDRWMLRPRAGPDPATTRTSHTPGLRSRSDPVPRSDRFTVNARSL